MSGSPLLWFTFQDAACCSWRVFVGNDRQIPQLEGREAVTLPEQHLIAIDSGLPDDRKRVLLLHEVLHACISGPGDSHTLEQLFVCDANEVERREENIVALIAPRLFNVLTTAGFLRLPKLPRGRR